MSRGVGRAHAPSNALKRTAVTAPHTVTGPYTRHTQRETQTEKRTPGAMRSGMHGGHGFSCYFMKAHFFILVIVGCKQK